MILLISLNYTSASVERLMLHRCNLPGIRLENYSDTTRQASGSRPLKVTYLESHQLLDNIRCHILCRLESMDETVFYARVKNPFDLVGIPFVSLSSFTFKLM